MAAPGSMVTGGSGSLGWNGGASALTVKCPEELEQALVDVLCSVREEGRCAVLDA